MVEFGRLFLFDHDEGFALVEDLLVSTFGFGVVVETYSLGLCCYCGLFMLTIG